MITLIDDKREIQAIWWNDENGYKVNASITALHADKIIPYNENGEYCHIPWLAVYKDDQIICRVPAWQVSIYY